MEIKYKGKKYKVEEPTIEMWSKLILLQDWTDGKEFSIKLLSMITGLSEEDIENADMDEIIKVSTQLSEFLMKNASEFKNEFEFNDKKYRFLDLSNLTFGEFIDIDTYLSKSEVEKKKEMHMLMAMLYREVDEKGDYKPYDSKLLQARGEEFKKLPVKYVNGATTFFLLLDKTLQGDLRGSFWDQFKMMMKMIWLLVKFGILINFGLGLGRLYLWLMKISRRLTKSPNTP